MKKHISIFLAVLMLVSLAACSKTNSTSNSQSVSGKSSIVSSSQPSQTSGTVSGGTNPTVDSGTSKVLITYFSYGENSDLPKGVDASTSASIQPLNGKITGNTGLIANMIKNETGGELFSILTSEKYPADYDKTVSKGQAENNAKARPALASHIKNLSDYDIIFLGFPNWWYDMPMAVYTFLDEYDLSGKTIIPFSTSGGSGFSDTIATIKKAEPNAKVLDGLSVGDSSVSGTQNKVTKWLKDLNILR